MKVRDTWNLASNASSTTWKWGRSSFAKKTPNWRGNLVISRAKEGRQICCSHRQRIDTTREKRGEEGAAWLMAKVFTPSFLSFSLKPRSDRKKKIVSDELVDVSGEKGTRNSAFWQLGRRMGIQIDMLSQSIYEWSPLNHCHSRLQWVSVVRAASLSLTNR